MFVMWPHGLSSLEEFHSHLNQQHPSIQFMREEEFDRSHNNSLPQTYPHRPVPALLVSPSREKAPESSLYSLRDRAHKVCDTSKRGKELSHLSKVFQTNGHPKPLVRRTLSRTPLSSSEKEGVGDSVDDDVNAETERPKILCLPYIKGVSERIERGCLQLGVRAVFKSGHKLR